MLTKYFQTCICCDDPIDVSGFLLHVCEECRREFDSGNKATKQIIACRLYGMEQGEESMSLGTH
jgi:hypothetical protein